MSKKQEIGGIVILIIIMLVLAIVFGHLFNLINTGKIITTAPTTTIPTSKTVNSSKNTTSYAGSCSSIYIYEEYTVNSTRSYRCSWTGGNLGIWVASGTADRVNIHIVGANNVTYLNQSSSYSCLTFLRDINLSAQNYTISFNTYGGGGTCLDPHEKLVINSTTSPSTDRIYDFVYNGNFSYDTYAGWTVINTTSFGTRPANIVQYNSEYCFKDYPWSGLSGNYFATTASCYHQPRPGELISSYFNASYPYLNFQIVSPTNNSDYIEILYNNTPEIIATYNTYLGENTGSFYRFQNASIPLNSVRDKIVRLAIISYIPGIHSTLNVSERPLANFTAIGDIHMSYIPWQYKNITTKLEINSSNH